MVDTVTAAQLERAISEVIANFEPRVSVSKVVATPSPDDNRYAVELEFFIINNPNPISIDFFLERIR
jgi:predicted component of type VI protein secretion system